MRLDGDDCAIVWGTACVALATAVLIGVFALGFFMGKEGASVSPEMPRTIRLQLEVLGAGASAPTITTNENEKETTGND